MRTRSFAFIGAAAMFASAFTVSHSYTAHAQGAPPAAAAEDPKEGAKNAYIKGQEAFKEGKYADALPHYQEAERLFPGAAPKLKIALCLDKLGRTTDAIAAYRAFIDSNPGDKYADRIAEGNKRISELEATLPATVTLNVSPPEAAGSLTVTVDGAPVQGTELSLVAGEHTVVVAAQGFQSVTETLNVRGGEKRELPVMLAAAAPPPAPAAPAAAPKAPEPPPEPPEERSNVPAYVTLGIAGAGVILGTIFGIQAIGAKSDFDDNPTVENADDAERAALISDMSFGVALTFGITGAVLLFSDDDPAAEASAKPVLAPYGGPTGGGMAATWKF